MPLLLPHSFNRSKLQVSGIGFIGYDSERLSPGKGLGSPETPSRRYTTRLDLSKVILDELETGVDVHKPMAVTSR